MAAPQPRIPPAKRDARNARAGTAVSDGAATAQASRPAEPVWLVRAVVVMFLVGFSLWLAREVRDVLLVWLHGA